MSVTFHTVIVTGSGTTAGTPETRARRIEKSVAGFKAEKA
jgi:hypothetical protein